MSNLITCMNAIKFWLVKCIFKSNRGKPRLENNSNDWMDALLQIKTSLNIQFLDTSQAYSQRDSRLGNNTFSYSYNFSNLESFR